MDLFSGKLYNSQGVGASNRQYPAKGGNHYAEEVLYPVFINIVFVVIYGLLCLPRSWKGRLSIRPAYFTSSHMVIHIRLAKGLLMGVLMRVFTDSGVWLCQRKMPEGYLNNIFSEETLRSGPSGRENSILRPR